MKRIISIFLIVAMLATTLPLSAIAAESDNGFSISASGGANTISVTEKTGGDDDTPGGSATGDILSLSADAQTIDRDYEQTVIVKVENTSEQAVEYYLECENTYDDIYMNFVSSGSVDAPLTILAGETQNVELNVFAQNAQNTSYTVGVKAVVTGESESVTMDLTFGCDFTDGAVSFTKGSVDPATLTTTYTVENTGTGVITDLTLSVAGEAQDYVRISPSVENYEIGANESIAVKLIPDLGKMKTDNKTAITGQLVASGGASAQADISFDINGQEITSMTMGQLALYQDGNPFYNLEMDEDSLSVKITNDSGETDINNYVATNGPIDSAEDIDNVLEMIIDETDATFNVSYGSEYVYGENGENTMIVNVQVSSKALDAAPVSLMQNKEYYTYDSASGTITYEETYYLTPEEYLKVLGDSTQDLGSALSIPDWAGKGVEAINPNAGAFEVVITKTVTDPALWEYAGFENPALKELGEIGDCISTAGDIVDVYTVLTDPTVDTETKTYYTGLTIAKNVLRWGKGAVLASPLDGAGYIGCLIGEYFIDQMLGDLDTMMNSSAMFYDIYGRQCTNAGKVTSNFYMPDFGDSEVKVYETGRMYDGSPYGGNAGYADEQFGGDNYIHDREVNYDYYLNGEKVGTTQNNGLTAVSIVELTGASEHLQPGNNKLVRDYDTNAGHYSVVADSEITILYPADTPISFIGTPEGLEDVRLLPDFAVYEENILPAAAIIGEETEVKVYVYNRGSRGGWADIAIGDGTTTFDEQENVYIDAFSEKLITFNWTPAGENTEFTVTLTNKSVGVDERKLDNNTASRTVNARSRQVPVIDSITPASVVLETGGFVRLVAGISNIADVKSVSFDVNGTLYADVSLAALSDTAAQAAVSVNSLSVGNNTVKAIVTYNTGASTTSTVEKTEIVTATEPSTITFSADGTIANPSFSVMRLDDSSFTNVSISVSAAAGGYSLTNNAAMEANPAAYYLLTTCDGGLIISSLSTLDGSTLSLSAGTAVVIETGDEASLSEVSLTEINGNDLDYPYPVVTPASDGTLLTSGITSYSMSIDYEIAGMTGYAYVDESDAVNGTINLPDYYKLYKIAMPADKGYDTYTDFDGSIWYTTATGRSYSRNISSYGEMVYTSSGNQLIVLFDDSYMSGELSAATSVQLGLIVDYNALYIVDLTNYSSPVSAIWNHYAISYSCTQANTLNVSDTELAVGNYTVYLWNAPFYLPVGNYDFMVSYEADGQQLYYIDTLEVINQSVTVELPGPVTNPTTASFTWPSVWDDNAYLNYSVQDSDGNYWNPSASIVTGEAVTLPTGEQSVYLQLNRRDGSTQIAYARFNLNLTLAENANTNVVIGSTFTGAADMDSMSYEAGEYAWVTLSDLVDVGGTELEYYSANRSAGYLNGRITLTNTTDPSKVYTVSLSENQIDSGSDVYFSLPENMATGNYTYEVFLTSGEIDNIQYTITFNPNGGSGTMAGKTVNAGETYTLPTCGFTAPANKEFKAWSISSIEYAPGYVYTVNNDTTIFAIWKDKPSSDIEPDYGDDSGSDSDYTPTYGVTSPSNVDNGSVTVSPKNASVGSTVTITVNPDDGYELDELAVTDTKGNLVELTDKGDGKYTFKMPASKVTIEANFKKMAPVTPDLVNPFVDIKEGTYFYDAVLWAVENGITVGTGDGTTFSPNADCTRAQIMTFLWRAAGSPEPSATTHSFTDVNMDGYYGNAVLWAVENGITNGTDADSFSPDAICTRAQIVTFLWRAAGSPEPNATVCPFDDVDIDSYYGKAVLWAVENGITNGTTATTFSPDNNCTRAQIVTFLWRFMGE